MAGPWEKYAKPVVAPADGPWAKYAGVQSAAPADPVEPGLGAGQVSLTSPLSALAGLFGGSTEAAGQSALNAASLGNLANVEGIGQKIKSNQATNPISSGVGSAAGIAATMPAVGAATAALPASGLAGIGSASAIGGATGALQAPGKDETRLGNAAKGMALGGVAQGLISGAANAGNILKSAASEMSGISPTQMETYLKNPSKIDAIVKKFPNIEDAADSVKQNYQNIISSTKNALGKAIGAKLDAPEAASKFVKANTLEDALNQFGTRINTKLPSGQQKLGQLEDLRKEIQSVVDENGNISLPDLHSLKESMQEMAAPAYYKNGQIFERGKNVQVAAKKVAAEARKIFNIAEPDLAEINNKLSQLHGVERNINKNMLTQGKTSASLFSAGTQGGINAQNLEKLGSITGKDFLGQAQDLAAARDLGSAKILPNISTGKALLGPLMAAGGASLHSPLAMVAGIPPALMSSPAAIKYGLKGANALNLPQLQELLKRGASGISPGVVGSTAARIRALGE